MSDHEAPELIKRRLSYQGRAFSFDVNTYRLPNGFVGEWECIRHPGGALAVPVTDEGKFVLVKQYRCAVETRLWEFPAGTVEPKEDPAQTIQRELIEEAGYEARSWQNLGKFPLCPGYSDEYIYAYLARDLVKLPSTAHEADEDMEVILMDHAQFIAAIATGLMDAKTICSFWLAQPFLHLPGIAN